MANLITLKNIMNNIIDNIGSTENNIWFGTMAKNINNQAKNLLNAPQRYITITLIEKQITLLEDGVRKKYNLENQVANYAKSFGIYNTMLYKYQNNLDGVTEANVQFARNQMNIAKQKMDSILSDIEEGFQQISRARIETPSLIKEEPVIYTIDLKDIEAEIITNGLEKVNYYLESLKTELQKPLFESVNITKQSVAPYQSITVHFEIAPHRNIVIENIEELIRYINNMISKIKLHIDNITLFENNEAVEIPLDDSEVQEPAPETQREVVYEVKRGDTLTAISAAYGISWQSLYDANKEKIPNGDPRKLQIGTNLVIPGKTTTVIPNDNIETIGNEVLEASSEIPEIKPIVEISKLANSNWGIDCGTVTEGEYSSPVPLQNGKMVDKDGNVFRVSSKMSAYYNNGVYAATGGRSGHTGTDFASGGSDYGTNISTLGSGIVIAESDTDNGGFGKYVRILHETIDEDGNTKYVVSTYAHLSSNSVEVGDIVSANDVIGELGDTGNSTGSHLHLELANVNLTEEELRGKNADEVVQIARQKGITTNQNFGKDNYYDMGVYFTQKDYLK